MQTQNKIFNQSTRHTDTPVDKNMAYKQTQTKHQNPRQTQQHKANKTSQRIQTQHMA